LEARCFGGLARRRGEAAPRASRSRTLAARRVYLQPFSLAAPVWALTGCTASGNIVPDLQEAAQAVALDAEADHSGRAVDLVDHLGRDEAAAAGKQSGADGERVGCIWGCAVHRALDPSDDPAAAVCDEEALGAAEVIGDGAHVSDGIPGL
jgi:hypothetical protein